VVILMDKDIIILNVAKLQTNNKIVAVAVAVAV